jgi:hypothetical protein
MINPLVIPAVCEEKIVVASLKKVALAQRAAEGKQIQTESQQHSADSWESLYHDASIASPLRADVAQETLREVASMITTPVVPPSTGGNNYRTWTYIASFEEFLTLQLLTEPATESISLAPELETILEQRLPTISSEGNYSDF